MAEKYLFICDMCADEYSTSLHIEKGKNTSEETCAFCGKKKPVRYCKVIYGRRHTVDA